MAEQPQPPLLALPGELRNLIYAFVAASTPTLHLYKGALVPPPLANTCRQIRRELNNGDWYAKEVALDHTIPIAAHFTNFDFTPLYDWLAENDNRPAEQNKFLRVLDIELALVSPSSGTPGFASSSLAMTRADGEGGGKGDSMVMSRTTALATDRKTILSCDANWVKNLAADLVTLGCATYGADKSTRANNSQLYTPTGRRRRFAESVAGNGYLTSCSTRIEYLHHPRVPILENTNNPNNPNTTTTPTPAHPAFIHSADYFATLTPLLSPSPPLTPTASQLCAHALCVRQFRRQIYLGLLKSQLESQKLKWDRKYYSSLTPEAQKVVRFYRLLDPLPKAKLNSLRAAFGAKVVTSGRKRGVGEVYASGEGFGGRFGSGFVDRAWVGCEKRRFGSGRGDAVAVAVGLVGRVVGAATAGAAASEAEDCGDGMLFEDDVVVALMGRLRLGAAE